LFQPTTTNQALQTRKQTVIPTLQQLTTNPMVHNQATTSRPEMHTLDYNVIEDMKKTKANISMYDICTLPTTT
jgi:hypothetical protein